MNLLDLIGYVEILSIWEKGFINGSFRRLTFQKGLFGDALGYAGLNGKYTNHWSARGTAMIMAGKFSDSLARGCLTAGGRAKQCLV